MAETKSFELKSDELVDELLPESLDWRHLVCTYPLPALGAAAAGGLWLGLRHGSSVVAALTAFAGQKASQVMRDMVVEDLP